MEQMDRVENVSQVVHTLLSHEAIEAKLAQLLTVSRLIDVPVETVQDWHARKTCEDLYCQIDGELRSASIRYSYSKRAGRFLRERYRLVIDNFFTERGKRVACWTLIDTQADEGRGAPVFVLPHLTCKTQEAAQKLALPLNPLPAFYSAPIRTPEDRAQAQSLCEQWNLAAAHFCPQCTLRFPEDELPEEEAPYLNRAQLRCSACKENQRATQRLSEGIYGCYQASNVSIGLVDHFWNGHACKQL